MRAILPLAWAVRSFACRGKSSENHCCKETAYMSHRYFAAFALAYLLSSTRVAAQGDHLDDANILRTQS